MLNDAAPLSVPRVLTLKRGRSTDLHRLGSIPVRYHGQPLVMAAVGDVARFQTGQEKARFEFVDRSLTMTNMEPHAYLYIDEVEPEDLALEQAGNIVASGVVLLSVSRSVSSGTATLRTNRGEYHVSFISCGAGAMSATQESFTQFMNAILTSMRVASS